MEDKERKLTGLERDYRLISGKNSDVFLLHLTRVLNEGLTSVSALNSRSTIEVVDGIEVCRIDVRPSDKQVFVNAKASKVRDEFFVRHNNSTQRYAKRHRQDEEALRGAIISLASQYRRYGYRRITALLRADGWEVNPKRVQRIWREEGLKVPTKQPKRGRLWLNDGSCVRLRPGHPNDVWAYDFVHDRTHDGKVFKLLTVIDEFTRECLAIEVGRRLRSDDVLHCLARLFTKRRPPQHIRSDNGPEFIARAVRNWLSKLKVTTLYAKGRTDAKGRTERIFRSGWRISRRLPLFLRANSDAGVQCATGRSHLTAPVA